VDFLRQTIEAASLVVTGGSAVLRRLSDNSFNVQHQMKPGNTPSVTRPATSAHWNVGLAEIRLADFAAEINSVFGHETVAWKDLRISKPAFQMNPPAASVAEVTLQDGKLVFTDSSLQPPVRMALTHLDARIGAFSWANPRPVSVAVHARIDDAELQISGETNTTGTQGAMNLRGLLQNVSLVPLSPYVAKYLGYELTAGALSLDVAFLMQGRKISAKNKLKIDQLTFGGKIENTDATKLPVRLVIFLLKDQNGTITLNVPIGRTLDDPKFELQKTIIDAALHPFTKTAIFPFAALDAPSGGEGEELGVQEFSSGSAELIPRETGKLDTILQGLRRWPEFMLDIEGSVDARNDSGDLELLAADRARTVKEYLLREGTLEPDRIFLIDNPLEKVAQQGGRALLSLKDRYRSLP
jgi:hypothetical protein